MKDTQRTAFAELNNKQQKQALVLKAIKSYNGLTFFELVKILEWPINRVTPRVNELVKIGLVKDSGSTRVNPESMKSGVVWI